MTVQLDYEPAQPALPWRTRLWTGIKHLGAERPPLFDPGARISGRLLVVTAIAVALLYALLWSPHWYPLSDSALYLVLARALANGHGFSNMGAHDQMVMPATPWLLSLVIRCGGGIGAMQALLTALMLLSHALCYFTLCRWVGQRMAYIVTFAYAISYWVLLNAATIMTEPLFLVMVWGALLTLSYVPGRPARSQWLLVIVAVLLMAGAWSNRIAAAGLVPGAMLGLWMSNGRTSRAVRVAWMALFVAAFAAMGAAYWHEQHPAAVAAGPATTQAVLPQDKGREGEDAAPPLRQPDSYDLTLAYKITDQYLALPTTAGRWVCEGLCAPSVLIFKNRGGIAGYTVYLGGILVALSALALSVLGWFWMIRQRQWWVLGLAAYFLPVFVKFGTRLKPRYMIPIVPILFLMLWAGLTVVIAWFRGQGNDVAARRRIGLWVAGGMLGLGLLGNLPAWGLEFYIRHDGREFYDQARRGAFAELVDIGAYIQNRPVPALAATRPATQPGGVGEIIGPTIWTNDARGMAPRVISFLTGLPTYSVPLGGRKKTIEAGLGIDGDPEKNPLVKAVINRVLDAEKRHGVRAEYVIIYCTATGANASNPGWPDLHLPLEPDPRHPPYVWWRLYERDPATGGFRLVKVPRTNGSYVRDIPPSEY